MELGPEREIGQFILGFRSLPGICVGFCRRWIIGRSFDRVSDVPSRFSFMSYWDFHFDEVKVHQNSFRSIMCLIKTLSPLKRKKAKQQ